jgi:chromosome segregation ATPase
LNHDRNHFAEATSTFEQKLLALQSAVETLEGQRAELTKELTSATNESARLQEKVVGYQGMLTRMADRMQKMIDATVNKMEYDEEVQRRKIAEMKLESETSLRISIQAQLESTHFRFANHVQDLRVEVEAVQSFASDAVTDQREAIAKHEDSHQTMQALVSNFCGCCEPYVRRCCEI